MSEEQREHPMYAMYRDAVRTQQARDAEFCELFAPAYLLNDLPTGRYIDFPFELPAWP